LALAGAKAAHGLAAVRLEFPARPSSVPDEDSVPYVFKQVFKNKAPSGLRLTGLYF
jgi:hypothetical protein